MVGPRGAGRGWDAGTRRAAECALRAGSGKSRIQAAPFLSPSSLPSLLPFHPPPSLDVGCRLSPRGTDADGEASRGRRGRAEGSGQATPSREPARGRRRLKRRNPNSSSAVGRRERAAKGGREGKREGRRVRSPRLPWWQRGARVGELAWAVLANLEQGFEAIGPLPPRPPRPPLGVMCYLGLQASHEGFAPLSLILSSTGLCLSLPFLVRSWKRQDARTGVSSGGSPSWASVFRAQLQAGLKRGVLQSLSSRTPYPYSLAAAVALR